MNRVVVFVLALAAVIGLGVVAYMMFEDSGAGPRVPSSVDSPQPAPKGAPKPADPAKPAPIAPKTAETVPIKTAPFVETPGAFHEGGIMGVVVNDQGATVDRALVELFEDTSALKDRSQEGEPLTKQQTKEDGLFLFDRSMLSLSERYLIKVSHPMFVTERKSVDVKKPESGVIYVTLRPGTAITGTVRTVRGGGLANATVTVYDMNQNALDPNGSVETFALTDVTGQYSIGHVSPGMKKIQATAAGYATGGRQGVNVEGGRAVNGMDFSLNEGGVIAGQLVSTDGTAVANAFVTARPVRVGPKPEPDGAPHEVKEIQAKREMQVRDRERAMQITDREAIQKQEAEEAAAGQERDGEMKNDPGEQRARKADAQARMHAQAEAQKHAPPPVAGLPSVKRPPIPAAQLMLTTLSVRSGPDGSFAIQGAEVGSYVVSVNAAGYMPPPQQSVESPSQGVNFILQPHARILGRVVDDETGKPVAVFSIGTTMNPDDVLIPSYSKKWFGPPKFADGNFEYLDVKPGKIWLVAEANGYAGGRSAEVSVSQGERREGVEIRLVRGATIKGRVVDAKGNPIAGATVQPEPASSAGAAANPFLNILTQNVRRDIREATTDAEGRYALPNMLAGSYVLSVRHPDFGPHSTQPFQVPMSGEALQPDVALARGASIRGRIRLADGQPDAKAMVNVSPVGGPVNLAAHRTAYTDSEGVFEVNGLSAGQYRVVVAQRNGQPDLSSLFKGIAQQNQGQPQTNVFTISEGEVKEVDL